LSGVSRSMKRRCARRRRGPCGEEVEASGPCGGASCPSVFDVRGGSGVVWRPLVALDLATWVVAHFPVVVPSPVVCS
jgi:hypothetical protein